MKTLNLTYFCGCLLLTLAGCKEKAGPPPMEEKAAAQAYEEAYRPQYHFSPMEHWMNDPNGLVFHEGTYHLFYQYYPSDIVWGPMHWGHAVSKDLVYWEHKPIALYPDQHGYIFSGSAVVDHGNTSGFGIGDTAPLVAVFTYHNADMEQAGRNDYQTQGIAYSTDGGETWIKYQGNPVLPNTEGIKDFRDPKVFWHEASAQWIMVLVAGDHARIYRSPDLKAWEYLSDFGREQGAHGGVWECPDLFPLKVNGDGPEKWVLLISINPGAPNGGSGTQYFIGDFDGTTFRSSQKEARWLDWGTDNYAGVTYNNVPSGDRLFIGWMSNWDYANSTPTETWRSAMTLPRNLSLRQLGDTKYLVNYPVRNLGTILSSEHKQDLLLEAGAAESLSFDHFNQSEIRFITAARDFQLSFRNAVGDTLKLQMRAEDAVFELNREASGLTDFDTDFSGPPQQMPVGGLPAEAVEFRILIDRSSVEVFLNGGQYAMTSQIFPRDPYNELLLENTSAEPLSLEGLEISRAESIWVQTPE